MGFMNISLNGYKVVHEDKVLNAVSLQRVEIFEDPPRSEGVFAKADSVEVIAVDTDGTLIVIRDAGSKFQFIPRIN